MYNTHTHILRIYVYIYIYTVYVYAYMTSPNQCKPKSLFSSGDHLQPFNPALKRCNHLYGTNVLDLNIQSQCLANYERLCRPLPSSLPHRHGCQT